MYLKDDITANKGIYLVVHDARKIIIPRADAFKNMVV